jgi:hypothetical protein
VAPAKDAVPLAGPRPHRLSSVRYAPGRCGCCQRLAGVVGASSQASNTAVRLGFMASWPQSRAVGPASCVPVAIDKMQARWIRRRGTAVVDTEAVQRLGCASSQHADRSCKACAGFTKDCDLISSLVRQCDCCLLPGQYPITARCWFLQTWPVNPVQVCISQSLPCCSLA